MSESNLILRDVPDQLVKTLVDSVFSQTEAAWADRPGGSPYQRWYRGIATSDDETVLRPVALKENKEFIARNIFVRTLDTGRLKPLNTELGIRLYAVKQHWDDLERSDKRKQHDTDVVGGIVSHHKPS